MPESAAPFRPAARRAATPPRRDLLRIYWLEARYEFLKNLRLPVYSLSTLLFPVMFYLFFGVMFGQGDVAGIEAPLYYALTYGAFGVIGAALFGFGVGVAVERGQGWMRLKQASPMPPAAYFVAKIVMSVLFGLAIVGAMLTLSATVGGAAPTPLQALAAVGVAALGALPFCALGLAIGYLVGPNSAPAVVNLAYLPSAFLGGLWIPVQAFPEWLQALAPLLPTYHLGQLALAVVGAGAGDPVWRHVVVLAAWTSIGLLAAAALFRRDEGATYG